MTERQEIVTKLRAGNARSLTEHELELTIGALEFADFAHQQLEYHSFNKLCFAATWPADASSKEHNHG